MSTMKKIEDAVVGGYNKVEDTVVGGYKKVEDKFVDTFLKKEGETVEEAKERIAKEQADMKTKQEELVKKSTVNPNVSGVKTTAEIQAEIKEKYGK